MLRRHKRRTHRPAPSFILDEIRTELALIADYRRASGQQVQL